MIVQQETDQEQQERLACCCEFGCLCSCGPFIGVAVVAAAVGAIVGGGSAAFNAVISNPVESS